MRKHNETAVLACDVAVIGGGLGGVAAALAATNLGKHVILTEETAWLGGQITSQGVSALDEHRFIEQFGGTATYYALRQAIRDIYVTRYGAPAGMPDGASLNPGNGWVSRLCFEPKIGLEAIEMLLRASVESGLLQILTHHRPVRADAKQGRIQSVTLRNGERRVKLEAAFFLDATEQGDLLPLAGADYATGAESVEQTGEPHAAADGAHPDRIQSFTACFLLEYRAGENHTIRRPRGYAAWRDAQPFTLILKRHGGATKRFYMFEGDLPFWTYRRLVDSELLNHPEKPHDIALINWESNDYYSESIVDCSQRDFRRIWADAKRVSRSFLYWLQTEAPHDDDQGFGYPGFRLVEDALGTDDGMAMYPYIREGRRLRALRVVTENDIIATPAHPDRAQSFPDSVGIGWYPIDLHRCVDDHDIKIDFPPSLPFEIPLGMLIADSPVNLIAAGKAMGTTHITNGAYRLHPIEWNAGESAGALAAFCLDHAALPAQVRADEAMLHRFQSLLGDLGIPIRWRDEFAAG